MFISKGVLREMLACAPVIFNQILIGLGYGWTAPMLMKLQNANSVMLVDQEQASWIASIHDVGRVSGPFISPFIVDRIGRKYSVILVSVLLFLIWPSQIYITNAYLLCFVRLMFGITNGISDVAAAIYVTENCSADFRAVMGALTSITFAAGSFAEFIIASYLSYKCTAIVNAAISVCTFGTLYFCTETPSFLIMKERYDEAVKNFIWLRGDVYSAEVSDEFEKLENNVREEKQKQKSLKALFSSTANVKSLCIVLGLYVCVTATGASSTGPYALVIFQPSENFSARQFALWSSIIHFVSICMALVVISKFSRRKLLIVGLAMIGLCQACTATLFWFHNRHYEIPFYPWLVFASVTLFGTFGAISFPGIFVVRTEVLPLSVRAIGSSMAVIVSALSGFLITKIFQPITTRFGMEANFLFYASMGILTSILVCMFVPETRGKTLDEIQESLEKKSKSSTLDGAGEKPVST